MSLKVVNPGLQTTLQASPREGFRHKGVPSCGPADPLSMALANRLVGNALDAPSLEITLSAASFKFTRKSLIALTGGQAEITLNGNSLLRFQKYTVNSQDIINIKALSKGARIYLAIAGGFQADTWLGSRSTYLPAGLGGHQGRILQPDDEIHFNYSDSHPLNATQGLITPSNLRPFVGHSWMLRAAPGPDINLLSKGEADLYKKTFTLSNRASRMGAELDGHPLTLKSDGRLPSAAVFPGTVQCPPSGKPFVLMADAGTTGGYPRIAQIIRADRHMLGQIRPGDRIQFKRTTPQEAAAILKAKTALFRPWLGHAFELR